ncbi:hypothetical protein SDC9_96654 [bioreactor metagenome]|uniref:Uncharacterized protein n=1 Tax=bioreactor metagenome TaxID=1076179 RepID=A0A645A9Q5_9ZZZZ
MTRLPAKPTVAPVSARMISPCIAKLAVTPPVVGSVRTVMYNSPALLWLETATLTFAICIKDMMPSCILAPPEAVKTMIGSFSTVARSNASVSFSPTTFPMLAMIKFESITHKATLCLLMNAAPVTTASSSPVFSLAIFNLFSYPGKANGFSSGIWAFHSSKEPSSTILEMRSYAEILKL